MHIFCILINEIIYDLEATHFLRFIWYFDTYGPVVRVLHDFDHTCHISLMMHIICTLIFFTDYTRKATFFLRFLWYLPHIVPTYLNSLIMHIISISNIYTIYTLDATFSLIL